MKSYWLRPAALVGLSVLLAACGTRDGASREVPTSPGQGYGQGAAAVLLPHDPYMGAEMLAASVGAPPQGFQVVVSASPRPGADGVIRGATPLTVEYDLCGSTADSGKVLFFYFDWDFNNVADAGGTGDNCRQSHTYSAMPANNPLGDDTIRTNVCVANGDFAAHSPGTFVACRQYTVALPERQSALCHSINAVTGPGGGIAACPTGAREFCYAFPIKATSRELALGACQACGGEGNCFDQGGYWRLFDGAFHGDFIYTTAFTGCVDAGDIANATCGHRTGRWAP